MGINGFSTLKKRGIRCCPPLGPTFVRLKVLSQGRVAGSELDPGVRARAQARCRPLPTARPGKGLQVNNSSFQVQNMVGTPLS